MRGCPSDTEVTKGSTHDQCKAITTRSGRNLAEINKNKQGEKTVDRTNAKTVPEEPAPTNNIPAAVGKDQHIPSEVEEANSESLETPQPKLPRTNTLEDTKPPPPFPQRLKKQKQEYQFKKFLDILK
ncbi:hypothetical protein GQ457_02G023020 [Hibiscus cannabinus]